MSGVSWRYGTIAGLAAGLVSAGIGVVAATPDGGPEARHVSVREMECPQASCLTGMGRVSAVAPGQAVPGWTPETFTPVMVEEVTKAAAHPLLGKNLAGSITDATGTSVWSTPGAPAMMPASSMKMVTALAVLTGLPADQSYGTSVRASVGKGAATVVVRGEGDPTLVKARIDAVAAQAASALKLKAGTKVTVLVDDTAFPAPVDAAGWKPVYFSDGDMQPVRPLTYNGYKGKDGPLQVGRDVAAVFKKAKAKIVTVKRGVAPRGAKLVGALTSATTSELVARMLQVSDNFIAEVLIRHLAVARKQPLTWAGVTGSVRSMLVELGIPVEGYAAADGSGLSRRDRVPVATMEAAVRAMWTTPTLKDVVFAPTGVPRAGESGTLASRYAKPETRCAKGQVWAKTGMLDDVAALAGIAWGADGTPRVFVLMENGNKVGEWAKVKDQIDVVATAIVGCNLTPPAASR